MPRITGRNRKTELLEAACDLIFVEGASRFTIRRLAERVELTEAAVYRHFSGKEELLLSLLETKFAGWKERIQEILASPAEVKERVRNLALFHLEYLLQARFNPILLLSDAADPDQKNLRKSLFEIASALFKAIHHLIHEGQKSGELDKTLDAEGIAVAFQGAIQNTVLQWTLTPQIKGLESRLRKTIDLLLQVFESKTVPSPSSRRHRP